MDILPQMQLPWPNFRKEYIPQIAMLTGGSSAFFLAFNDDIIRFLDQRMQQIVL
jgi:hypothetical protein